MTTIKTFAATFLMVLLLVQPSVGQTPPDGVFGGKGIQPNHDYASLLPWEHVDVVTGSLVLTFTDLVLPGNAGRELRFQRTFNSKDGGWSFGIAGVPMLVYDPRGFVPQSRHFSPSDPDWSFQPEYASLLMADNGMRLTAFPLASTTVSGSPGSTRYMGTGEFWVYDRQERKLRMPDGVTCWFDEEGRLITVVDAFANTVALDYDTPSAGQVTVRQILGADEVRTVVLTGTAPLFPWLPSSMTFAGRTWTYAGPGNIGSTVTLPEGVQWHFVQAFGQTTDTLTVTTPHGGTVTYTFEMRSYTPASGVGPTIWTRLLRTRTAMNGSQTATWQYDYSVEFPDSGQEATTTIVEPPTTAGGSGRTIAFFYGGASGIDCAASTSPNILVPAWWLSLRRRTVSDATRTWEEEQRTYKCQPVRSTTTSDGLPQLTSRRVTRFDGGSTQTFTTTIAYRGADYADYHRPWRVTETGPTGASRVTEYDYDHTPWESASSSPYIVGLPVRDLVTIGSETLEHSAAYNGQGFRTSDTAAHVIGSAGITTAFTPDANGNVQTATNANGHTTAFEYRYGQVSRTITPEYVVTRDINPDGTVASETRAGRTTSYVYDDLGRVTLVQPPGANPVITTYEASGTSIITQRGPSSLTTTLDGFGRPTGTVNSIGVKTVTRYDAEGRKIFESFPFTGPGNGIGVAIEYDALDRVILETNGDNSNRQRTYAANTITIRDEEGRETRYTRRAFGHPDDAQLVGVHDAEGSDWAYTYNVAGALTGVTGPNGVSRSWVYDARFLLQSETHPESGTVHYELYDAAGVLKRKKDARGTTFLYEHDGNDRVIRITAGGQITTFGYEPGSDNRRSAEVDGQLTRFHYNAAGLLDWRQDVMDDRNFVTRYDYDGNGMLSRITYPSGRKVRYDYDNENRLKRVWRESTEQTYANTFDHHPSGALSRYQAGNGLETTLAYHPTRYWLTSVNVPGLSLTYEYFNSGNVKKIVDPGWGEQNFTYDALDRLKTINGPYGPSTFDYDAHGNRLNGVTYDPANRFRLATIGITPVGFDANGNMTHVANAEVYRYTPDNLMASTTATGSETRFTYDADAWRLKKENTNTGAITYSIRGANGQLLTEWSTSPLTTRDYIYAGSRLIAVAESVTPLPGSGTSPNAGHLQVTLASWAGRFVASEDYGAHPMYATRAAAFGWEQFTIVDVNGGQLLSGDLVHLRADQWRGYVRAIGGGGGSVDSGTVTPAAWETFRIHRVGGSGPIALQTPVAFESENGHYLSVDTSSGAITATATSITAQSTFTLWDNQSLPSVLAPGQYLFANESRTSLNGRYRLVYQGSDGNLVLYDTASNPWNALWSSQTQAFGAGHVLMETSGSLIIEDPNGVVRCSTTGAFSALYLNVGDDGFARIHTSNGFAFKVSPGGSPVCVAP